jgi:hypothetical protein
MKPVRVALGLPVLMLGMAIGLLAAGLVALGLNIQGESLIKVQK